MCDSFNFWQFRDGKIVSYSDQHLTDYAAGSYEYLGLGRYKVTITRSERPPLQWTVHPRRDSWAAPPANLKEWFFYDRRFNRVPLSGREEAIIKDAPERDDRFRAIIEKRKADKATKEANKANQTFLLTPDPPPVQAAMTATTSTRRRSLAPGQA